MTRGVKAIFPTLLINFYWWRYIDRRKSSESSTKRTTPKECCAIPTDPSNRETAGQSTSANHFKRRYRRHSESHQATFSWELLVWLWFFGETEPVHCRKCFLPPTWKTNSLSLWFSNNFVLRGIYKYINLRLKLINLNSSILFYLLTC